MKTILETDNGFICDITAPCFQSLNNDEIDLIRSSKTQVLFRKGDSLTKQGAFSSYVLFVITGFARQYIEGDGNRNFNLRIIQPGEFLGLSAIFNQNTFKYSSVAITDCQVFLIEKEAIGKLARKNGNFGFGITKRYCEENAGYLSILNDVVYKQMNGRMAATLLYIDRLKAYKHDIFQLLSRKDLADFAGISTESAVKLLKTLEKEGIIELNDKDIKILKYDSLAEISRRG